MISFYIVKKERKTMKYCEMQKLVPYILTKSSSDKTFRNGDIILISPSGDINSIQRVGWIIP